MPPRHPQPESPPDLLTAQEVARRLSRGPRADGGGVQGELARSDLPPSYADLIFALKPGEVSPVVPAEYGFHLFQVIEREPAEVVPLAAARGEILAKLRHCGEADHPHHS